MRILLLTLYYPPLNTIAALRIKAFEKYFKAEGHQVDIITRYYDEQQQQGKSMFLGSESPENFNVPYIKQDHVIYTNFKARNEKKDFSEKLPPFIKGIYNYLNVDIYHYSWLSYVLLAFDKELKPNKYDF
ncbi:MAG TPA: hypothetical protein VFF27_01350, partial [Bacteroidia bacterium]|nr:hypothetical protein [Bacteroidia bacterium]